MRQVIRDRPVLALMGMQIVVWAALFYSFPAMALHWESGFGWPLPQIMPAFTLAIGIYALSAPVFGRLIDRGLGPRTLPLGTALGAGCLALVPMAPGLPAFYFLWSLIGVAMGLCLYEPVFALLTRARGARARQAITAVTLVAGFAGSVAYPLSATLTAMLGRAGTLWVMAGLVVCLAGPLAAFAARRLEAEAQGRPETAAAPVTDAIPLRTMLRRPGYLPLAAGFAMAALATGIVLSLFLPILDAQGVPDRVAILAATLVGPAQVAGRLGMMAVWGRIAAIRLAQIAMLVLAAGGIALIAAGYWVAFAGLFALLQGAGYGVVGIMRSVVTRDVLGERGFGQIAGLVSAPALFLFALAPGIGGWLAATAGWNAVLALAVIAPLLGAVALTRIRRSAP